MLSRMRIARGTAKSVEPDLGKRRQFIFSWSLATPTGSFLAVILRRACRRKERSLFTRSADERKAPSSCCELGVPSAERKISISVLYLTARHHHPPRCGSQRPSVMLGVPLSLTCHIQPTTNQSVLGFAS